MKRGNSGSSLNLPTLLSFNELAWVAVSAMALFCGYLLTLSAHRDNDEPLRQVFMWSNDVSRVNRDLNDLSNRLAQVAAERMEASNRLVQAEGKVQSLTEQLSRERAGFMELSNRLADAAQNMAGLETQLSSATNSNAQLRNQLQQASNRVAGLEEELRKAANGLSRSSSELAKALARLSERPSEGNIRKELLNLRGAMTNVVILLDSSASMADGGRWQDSLRVINSWLKYLPIENCALVSFSSECQPFPPNGQFLRVGGTNAAAREGLLRQVELLQPKGNTAIVEALEKAYAYPGVDTIILFTDGEPLDLRRIPDRKRPTAAKEFELTASERRQIAKVQIAEALELSRQHEKLPINVVALGDYFVAWKADFLRGLVDNTGGAFLGR